MYCSRTSGTRNGLSQLTTTHCQDAPTPRSAIHRSLWGSNSWRVNRAYGTWSFQCGYFLLYVCARHCTGTAHTVMFYVRDSKYAQNTCEILNCSHSLPNNALHSSSTRVWLKQGGRVRYVYHPPAPSFLQLLPNYTN